MKPKRNTGEENFLTEIEKQTQEVRTALQPQTTTLTQTNRLPEGGNSRLIYNRKLKAWLAPDNTNSQLEQTEVWWVNGRWMTRIEIGRARLEYCPANKPECEGFVWQSPEWIRTKADELERWETDTQKFSSSPEMSVVKMTRQMDAKLKKAQQKQRFLSASFDVLRQFQRLTPEERQELRQGLINAKFMKRFKEKGFVSYNGGLQVDCALLITFLQSRPMSVNKRRVDTGPS